MHKHTHTHMLSRLQLECEVEGGGAYLLGADGLTSLSYGNLHRTLYEAKDPNLE